MIIGNITIELKPASGETIEPVKLIRENKIWGVEKLDGTVRGLFPSEVRIASWIQEELIHKLMQHPS